MRNYTVVAKGIYQHKQTSEFLNVERFLIVRKGRRRFLLLNMYNHSKETLTGIKLEIEQFDVRGNSIGVKVAEFKKISYRQGSFILKEKVEVSPACIDFRVKITNAVYGDYAYRLGDGGAYVTYEKKKSRIKLDAYTVRRKTGKDGFTANPRRFSIPVFVSVFSSIIIALSVFFAVGQVFWFKETQDEFFLSNLRYTYVNEDRSETAPVYVTGYVGLGGDDIVIPKMVEEHPVVGIAQNAFENNYIIENVTIEEGLIVSSHAFENCRNLKSVTLKGDNRIGNYAFANCENLSEISATNLITVGEKAFQNAGEVKLLEIKGTSADENTPSIANDAFEGCYTFGTIRLDDFIYQDSYSKLFPSAESVEHLYLKNFYYSDYMADDASGALVDYFNGYSLDVKTIEIAYMDYVPANFANGCTSLENVTFKYLESVIIGDNAFLGCTALNEVSVPALITSVGAHAFQDTAITSFDARSLQYMGESAFANCNALASVNLATNISLKAIPERAFSNCTSLQSIILPFCVEGIGGGAFENCVALNSFIFQDNDVISFIGYNAFYNCDSLYSIELPSTITSIGEYAFAYCKDLHYVSLPKSLDSISSTAFECSYRLYEIENLSDLNIVEGKGVALNTIKVYNSALEERMPKENINGLSFVYYENAWILLEYRGSEKEIFTPSLVNGEQYVVWSYMFIENQVVEKVNFADGAVIMGEYLFTDSAVREVDFYQGNQELYWSNTTFASAGTLEVLDFGERSFESIPSNTFSWYYSLRKVHIPSSVTTIGENAFMECRNLEEVTGCAGVTAIESSAFSVCESLKKYAFNSSLRKIGDYAFSHCLRLQEFSGANWVESIGIRAFEYCNGLTYVTLPSSLQTIEDSAFSSCGNLVSVSSRSALTKVGNSAFRDCTSLRSVSLSDSVTYIGESAFYNCYSLQSMEIPSGISSILTNTFSQCSALASISGGESLTVIEDYAFENSGLKSLSLPYSVQRIGNNAFNYNNNLTDVSFNAQLENIGSYAFSNCNSLRNVYFNNSFALTNIDTGAFEYCTSLRSVSLPFSLKRIGYNGFYNCSSLNSVTINGATEIGEYAFAECKSLTSLNFSDSVSNIYSYAFYNCTALKSVVLPEALSTLATCAFRNCTSLSSVMLNNNLTEIGDYAFADCAALSYVEFGDSIQTIGSYAFMNCASLSEVNLSSNLQQIYYGAFQYCTNLETVYFYSSLRNIYSEAFYGCDNLHEIFNFSSLGLTKDSTAYGYVAYNALVIHEQYGNYFYKTNYGDYTFKYLSDGSYWALVSYNGTATELSLVATNIGGYYVDSYEIARYAFKDNNRLRKLTIGSAVNNIRSHAFSGLNNLETIKFEDSKLSKVVNYAFNECYNLQHVIVSTSLEGLSSFAFGGAYSYNLYYEGSSDDWWNNNGYNRYEVVNYYASVYYYDPCIHYAYEWNYQNGKVNTTIKELAVETVIKAPTCNSSGEGMRSCRTCNDTETYEMSALGHLYNGNNECTRCGYLSGLSLDRGTLSPASKFLTIENDKQNPFDLYTQSYSSIYSTAGRESSATLVFTAKTDLYINFDVELIGEECLLEVTYNGKTVTVNGSQWFYINLYAGDSITITYTDLREKLPVVPEDQPETSGDMESSDIVDVEEDVAQYARISGVYFFSMYDTV